MKQLLSCVNLATANQIVPQQMDEISYHVRETTKCIYVDSRSWPHILSCRIEPFWRCVLDSSSEILRSGHPACRTLPHRNKTEVGDSRMAFVINKYVFLVSVTFHISDNGTSHEARHSYRFDVPVNYLPRVKIKYTFNYLSKLVTDVNE